MQTQTKKLKLNFDKILGHDRVLFVTPIWEKTVSPNRGKKTKNGLYRSNNNKKVICFRHVHHSINVW